MGHVWNQFYDEKFNFFVLHSSLYHVFVFKCKKATQAIGYKDLLGGTHLKLSFLHTCICLPTCALTVLRMLAADSSALYELSVWGEADGLYAWWPTGMVS